MVAHELVHEIRGIHHSQKVVLCETRRNYQSNKEI